MSKRIGAAVFACLLSLTAFAAWDPVGDEMQFTIVEENDLKGLFDEEGNVIIPIAYEDLGWTGGMPQVFNNVIGYRERNRWGLIDIKNRKITDAVYYSLVPYTQKLIIASKGTPNSRKRVYGLIDNKGHEELDFRYHSLKPHHEQLVASIVINDAPSYGVVDHKGQAVIGFQYSKIVGLSDKTYAAFNQDNKMALISAVGKTMTGFEYDSISPFDDNALAIAYQNGKQGVIREDGTVLVPIEYQRVKIGAKGEINVLPFNKWYVMTGENKKIRSYTFEDIEPTGVDLYRIKLGNLATFVNNEGAPVLSESWQISSLQNDFAVLKKGTNYGVMVGAKSGSKKIILDTIYDTLFIDGERLMAASELDGGAYSWAMYDAAGTKLTSYVYQDIKTGSEGRFAAKRKGYWGFLDENGEEVIPCQYLSVRSFSHDRASVDFIDGQGVIDTEGNWTIKPFKYKGASLSLDRIHDDLYVFSTTPHGYEPARYGLVNSEGKEIYVSQYALQNNGHTVWEKNNQGKYGLVSYEGKRILETKYDTISALQEGVIYTFQKDGHYGVMNRDGHILVDLDNNFQELYEMSNHFLGVKIEDKFGFVDTLGRLRIANRYDSITHFESNMAAIKLLGRWGYINRSETLVVQPHFEKAYPFVEGLAVVRRDGKFGMVNKKGETVVPTEYDKIMPAKHNRFTVELSKDDGEKQVGLVSEEGMQLIYPKYDSLKDLGNGFVIISRNGRYGLLTTNGMSTIPLKYDNLKYDPYNDLYLALEEQGWKSLDINVQVGQ